MKYQKKVYRAYTLILQFGINMLVPIFLCVFLGIWLDKVFETSFLTIVFFFLGALAGARNIYVFAKQIYETPYERDEVTVKHSKTKKERNGENEHS